MHDVEAKNRPTWSGESFKAQLAVDHPAYSMVICKVKDKLKLVLLFAQYLTEWVKMTVIFITCDSLGLSILPGSYQTQRRDHIYLNQL